MSQNPGYDAEILELTARFEKMNTPVCLDVLLSMQSMYVAKDSDYAADGKPMGNLRAAEEVGVPAWKGTLIRCGDKKRRLESFVRKGSFEVNEKIEDTLEDLANYCLLMIVLFREARSSGAPSALLGEYGEARRSQYALTTDTIVESMRSVALRAILCSTQAENWAGEDWGRLKAHYDTITAHAREAINFNTAFEEESRMSLDPKIGFSLPGGVRNFTELRGPG